MSPREVKNSCPPLLIRVAFSLEYNDSDMSWVLITVSGMTAGVTVASMTYTALAHTASAAAAAAQATIQGIGHLASLGAGSGPTSVSIKLASTFLAGQAEGHIQTGGTMTATAAAAAAGVTTALAISIGSHIVYYTMEYGTYIGGKIPTLAEGAATLTKGAATLSHEAAKQIAEAYLNLRTRVDAQTGFVRILTDDDWEILETPTTASSDSHN